MLEDSKIAELKEKFGPDLQGMELPNGAVLVFRKPTRAEYDRFRDSYREGHKTAPTRELAKACLAHPSEADFDSALDRYPAVLNNEILLALQELAGHLAEIPVKKL